MNQRARSAITLTVVLAAMLWTATQPAPASAGDAALPHVVVSAGSPKERVGYDGVVEAVRQTVLAGQVAGAIIALDVKAGDSVKAGQTIARIDARAAEQNTAASDAQVQAARAALEVASRDVERQRQLFQKRYISEAALERAEAQFKSTRAQVDAQLAQAGAARTQTGFYTVRAPYTGIIAEVPVSLGDMAMPGRPIASIYDPTALRVAASIPQTALPASLTHRDVLIEIPSSSALQSARIEPLRVTTLPMVDPSSHTVTVRLDLPAGGAFKPGMFARAWIAPAQESPATRIAIPASAVVRRAELTAVYVLDPENRPLLRQVRLGRVAGDQVEVLAGVSVGDRVVTQPQMAARAAGSDK